MLFRSQSNHTHAEMYSFYIWKKYVEPNIGYFKPLFENVYYSEVKSIDDDACIVFDGLCQHKIFYDIRIYYCDKDNLPNPYQIAFRKSKGKNLPEKYGDVIQNVLIQCGFSWSDEYGGYFFTCNKSDELFVKLKQLIEELKINN